MNLSRRDLLKMGYVSAGTLMCFGLFGCSPQTNASSSEEPMKREGANGEMSAESFASSSTAKQSSVVKAAVVYFSCTGNTESIAEKVAAATNGTLMRIEPDNPYTSADLNYNAGCRANAEQDSGTARPALAAPVPDIAGYSTIYLGYPIWWGKAPRIILSFLESADLSGKTIVPFCTSGSSPISGSLAEIRAAAPDAHVLDGERFPSGATQQDVDSWISSL